LESGNDECPICLDMIENVSITMCGHRFCTECLGDLLDEREEQLRRKRKSTSTRNFTMECPVCRKSLKRNQITKVVDERAQRQDCDHRNQKRKLHQQRNVHLSKPSSKLKKLMDILREIKEVAPTDKCIVFSQWTSMLNIIEEEFEREDIGYCRLTVPCRRRIGRRVSTD